MQFFYIILNNCVYGSNGQFSAVIFQGNFCMGHSVCIECFCVILEKVVNSLESIIPIHGLEAGNLYKVHVESISLSGVARSSQVSFETRPGSGDQKMLLMLILVAIIVLAAVIALVFYR